LRTVGQIRIVHDEDRIRLVVEMESYTNQTNFLDQLESEGKTLSQALLHLHEEVEVVEGL